MRFVLPQLAPILEHAYKTAHDMGKTSSGACYAPPLEKERLADEQGRAVQDALIKWTEQKPSLGGTWETNSRNLPHVALHIGELHITAHRVLKPGTFPRKAHYRQHNSITNRCWLPGLEPTYDHAKRVYLFLLHGPMPEDPYVLGFIQLAVPEPKSYKWLYIQDVTKVIEENAPVEEIPEKRLATLKLGNIKANES